MLNTPKYSGEPTPQALASGLATLGRYGDEFMVHAAEGETVIPPEIFEANPQLKADLFRQMAMMGIKDPNRYVVGNSLNSINPLTGQPEFFFKKIFKSIKKVFKKVLPIIAPIVGNMILPGWGGMIASGLVTKMQGGSWGDVLKGAAISGIGSLAMGGLSGAMSGGAGGISSGMTGAFANPFSAASYGTGWNPLSGEMPWNASGTQTSLSNLTGSAPTAPVMDPSFGALPQLQAPTLSTGSAGEFVGGTYVGGGTPSGITSAIPGSELISGAGTLSGMGPDAIMGPGGGLPMSAPAVKLTPQFPRTSAVGTEGNPYTTQTVYPPTPDPTTAAIADGMDDFGPVSSEAINANFEGAGLNTTVESSLNPQQGLVGDTMDYLGKRLDPSPEAAMARSVGKYEDALKFRNDALAANNQAPLTVEQSNALYKKMVIDPGPAGVLKRYTPALAATALAGSALYGMFSKEEAEFKAKPSKAEKETIAYKDWGEIENKNSPKAQELFGIWSSKPYITRSAFEAQTGGPSARPDWRFLPEGEGAAENTYMGAAMGGEVVGPGTGTSDSIPARLSDGEFVMTASAVQNAGGGNRDLGAARMYDMMRRFEGGVA